MSKQKEMSFLCLKCGGLFTTKDKNQSLCRRCLGEGHSSRDWGEPNPTPLQRAKWNASKKAIGLMRETM